MTFSHAHSSQRLDMMGYTGIIGAYRFALRAGTVHRLICNLTSAALLAHVLLGCCWHHGHHCSHQLAAAAEVEVSHACGCAESGHEGTHSQEPVGGCGHGDDGCQGARCMFVSAAPGAAAAAPLVQHRDAVLLGLTAVDISPARSLLCGAPSLAAGCCRPLRIHLLHQVLLI